MNNEIIKSDDMTDISKVISKLPVHHKKLLGALIPMAEALGEDNIPLAEQMLSQLGSAIISPSDSGMMREKASIETVFVKFASNRKYLLPSALDFYMEAGILELPNSGQFWDSLADNRPFEGDSVSGSSVTSQHSQVSSLEEMPSGANLSRLDRQRSDMLSRLQIENSFDMDSDEENEEAPVLSIHAPSIPPSHVPTPAGAPPVLGAKEVPVFLQRGEGSNTSPVSRNGEKSDTYDQVKAIYDRCAGETKNGADISDIVKHLRATFGSSSTDLRTELIAAIPLGCKTSTITWPQLKDILQSDVLRDLKLVSTKTPLVSHLSESSIPSVDASGPINSRSRHPCTTPVSEVSISDSARDSPSSQLDSGDGRQVRGNVRDGRHSLSRMALENSSRLDPLVASFSSPPRAMSSLKSIETEDIQDFSQSNSRSSRRRHAPVPNSELSTFNTADTDDFHDIESITSLSPEKPRDRQRKKDVPLFLQPFNESSKSPGDDMDVLDWSAEYSPNKTPGGRRSIARGGVPSGDQRLRSDHVSPSKNSLDSSAEFLDSIPNIGSVARAPRGRRHNKSEASLSPSRRRRGEDWHGVGDGSTGISVDLDVSWDEEDIPPRPHRISPKSPHVKQTDSSQHLSLNTISPGSNSTIDRAALMRRNNSEASCVSDHGKANTSMDEAYIRACLGGEDLLPPMGAAVISDDTMEDIVEAEKPATIKKPRRGRANMFSLTALDISQSSLDESADLGAATGQRIPVQSGSKSSRDDSRTGSFDGMSKLTSQRSSGNCSVKTDDESKAIGDAFDSKPTSAITNSAEEKTSLHRQDSDKSKGVSEDGSEKISQETGSGKRSFKKKFSGVFSSASKLLGHHDSDITRTKVDRNSEEGNFNHRDEKQSSANPQSDNNRGMKKFESEPKPVPNNSESKIQKKDEKGSSSGNMGMFSRSKTGPSRHSSSWGSKGFKSFLGLKNRASSFGRSRAETMSSTDEEDICGDSDDERNIERSEPGDIDTKASEIKPPVSQLKESSKSSAESPPMNKKETGNLKRPASQSSMISQSHDSLVSERSQTSLSNRISDDDLDIQQHSLSVLEVGSETPTELDNCADSHRDKDVNGSSENRSSAKAFRKSFSAHLVGIPRGGTPAPEDKKSKRGLFQILTRSNSDAALSEKKDKDILVADTKGGVPSLDDNVRQMLNSMQDKATDEAPNHVEGVETKYDSSDTNLKQSEGLPITADTTTNLTGENISSAPPSPQSEKVMSKSQPSVPSQSRGIMIPTVSTPQRHPTTVISRSDSTGLDCRSDDGVCRPVDIGAFASDVDSSLEMSGKFENDKLARKGAVSASQNTPKGWTHSDENRSRDSSNDFGSSFVKRQGGASRSNMSSSNPQISIGGDKYEQEKPELRLGSSDVPSVKSTSIQQGRSKENFLSAEVRANELDTSVRYTSGQILVPISGQGQISGDVVSEGTNLSGKNAKSSYRSPPNEGIERNNDNIATGCEARVGKDQSVIIEDRDDLSVNVREEFMSSRRSGQSSQLDDSNDRDRRQSNLYDCVVTSDDRIKDPIRGTKVGLRKDRGATVPVAQSILNARESVGDASYGFGTVHHGKDRDHRGIYRDSQKQQEINNINGHYPNGLSILEPSQNDADDLRGNAGLSFSGHYPDEAQGNRNSGEYVPIGHEDQYYHDDVQSDKSVHHDDNEPLVEEEGHGDQYNHFNTRVRVDSIPTVSTISEDPTPLPSHPLLARIISERREQQHRNQEYYMQLHQQEQIIKNEETTLSRDFCHSLSGDLSHTSRRERNEYGYRLAERIELKRKERQELKGVAKKRNSSTRLPVAVEPTTFVNGYPEYVLKVFPHLKPRPENKHEPRMESRVCPSGVNVMLNIYDEKVKTDIDSTCGSDVVLEANMMPPKVKSKTTPTFHVQANSIIGGRSSPRIATATG